MRSWTTRCVATFVTVVAVASLSVAVGSGIAQAAPYGLATESRNPLNLGAPVVVGVMVLGVIGLVIGLLRLCRRHAVGRQPAEIASEMVAQSHVEVPVPAITAGS